MEKTGRQRRKWWLILLLAVILTAGYGIWALRRPLPLISPLRAVSLAEVKTPAGTVAWPAAGEASVGIASSEILETHGTQTSLPIASTAKLITALSVLRQKPLAPGEQGPLITLTANDVALYSAYMAQEGSVVPVAAGEQISEYQMLQALMLPSANNMADSLAIWAFGSLNAYVAYANNYAAQLGLKMTHIGADASGFSPTTTSSAQDLVKLGKIAMQNPVLAGIVGQPTASGLPIVNNIKNVNFLLGTSNIVGIKTGNTEEAGGVFVGAARVMVNGKPVTIVTAVLGSPSLFAAMKDSLNLIESAQANFKPAMIVKAGTVVGSYKIPWGGTVMAAAAQDMDLSGWVGSTIPYNIELRPIPATVKTGHNVGNVTVKASALNNKRSVTIKLQGAPSQPSAWWRLLHPLK